MSFEYTEIDKAKYADSVELLLYKNMDTNIKNIRYLLNIVNDLESKGVDKSLIEIELHKLFYVRAVGK